MTPEQTRAQHRAQHDLVVRSLLVAPTRSERSEERPRKNVKRSAVAVFVDDQSYTRRFVIPVVNERKL